MLQRSERQYRDVDVTLTAITEPGGAGGPGSPGGPCGPAGPFAPGGPYKQNNKPGV